MNEKFNLSESEQQIIETMWREGKALTRSQIIRSTENKKWKESSIHIILNRLLEKNSIEVDDIVKTATNYGRTYKPTFNKDEYDLNRLKNTYEGIKPSSKETTKFVSFLVQSQAMNKEELEEIEQLIKEYKEKA
ncbi:BlaI/MecI/CopY family transcriptional regulator [Peptoniphilus sp. KCTC 25270]|uniref:BlaI/MecI/CopY family transcriptional regulator n=1 Tax=Peptoniphilus sp. KCTC 25270 TaxID=2897414 RepID=UPI001E2F3AA9|nr:BlaI/MecI/CopY family transcriptional regulator [Peptoniphilus sp. KCTC 25270]MCD1147901.1 BlaI/MecI/CopY family transcriptional regulator [Peptoniphilus sp. KCTC 25270]